MLKNKFIKKNNIQNCWDFFSCEEEQRKQCSAFNTDIGRDCWAIASSSKLVSKKDFKYCWECPWFKKINPDF